MPKLKVCGLCGGRLSIIRNTATQTTTAGTTACEHCDIVCSRSACFSCELVRRKKYAELR